jgi:hypothetical protein
LPLATSHIDISGQNLLAHFSAEHDRISWLTFYRRLNHHLALRTIFSGTYQIVDVLRANQWLICQRNQHSIEFDLDTRRNS